MAASHPYEEPSLTIILMIFGFLFLLNVVNKVLDILLYCGLIGQIFVGVLFGTPVAKLLSSAVETTVSNLGYLGLILLVYEGGLSTSLAGLISSSVLATAVALTGILIPIALSFVLLSFSATPLQCFAAGASLSATSLGTTFATLSTSGLLSTHLGTVLTSAAMLDDVVGLIMLQVVAELSGGHGTPSDYGKVIGRALGASLGLVIGVVVIFRFALRPLHVSLSPWACSPTRNRVVQWIWQGPYTALFLHTSLLLALVVVGSLAGTSVLLAAFVAGVVVRWWGDEVTRTKEPLGLQVYEHFYGPVADRILKPFFFASIGFSIPISRMFHATTVWKGVVYAILMFLGKLATGLWLVPHSLESADRLRVRHSVTSFCREKKSIEGEATADSNGSNSGGMKGEVMPNHTTEEMRPPHCSDASIIANTHPSHILRTPSPSGPTTNYMAPASSESSTTPVQTHNFQHVGGSSALPSTETKPPSSPVISDLILNPRPDGETVNIPDVAEISTPPPVGTPQPPTTPPPRRALRAYSPALVGLAMTARGEIGFLIASVAESRGIFAASSAPEAPASSGSLDPSSTLYLIVVWAIVLCTVIGPIATGGLVRRVKRLDMQARY